MTKNTWTDPNGNEISEELAYEQLRQRYTDYVLGKENTLTITPMMNIKEVAFILKKSTHSVYQMVKRGVIECIQEVPNGKIYFTSDSINNYMNTSSKKNG